MCTNMTLSCYCIEFKINYFDMTCTINTYSYGYIELQLEITTCNDLLVR